LRRYSLALALVMTLFTMAMATTVSARPLTPCVGAHYVNVNNEYLNDFNDLGHVGAHIQAEEDDTGSYCGFVRGYWFEEENNGSACNFNYGALLNVGGLTKANLGGNFTGCGYQSLGITSNAFAAAVGVQVKVFAWIYTSPQSWITYTP
jgi:hypothetical protein